MDFIDADPLVPIVVAEDSKTVEKLTPKSCKVRRCILDDSHRALGTSHAHLVEGRTEYFRDDSLAVFPPMKSAPATSNLDVADEEAGE